MEGTGPLLNALMLAIGSGWSLIRTAELSVAAVTCIAVLGAKETADEIQRAGSIDTLSFGWEDGTLCMGRVDLILSSRVVMNHSTTLVISLIPFSER